MDIKAAFGFCFLSSVPMSGIVGVSAQLMPQLEQSTEVRLNPAQTQLTVPFVATATAIPELDVEEVLERDPESPVVTALTVANPNQVSRRAVSRTTSKTPPKKKTKKPPRFPEIVKVSEDHWEVEKELVDEWTDTLEKVNELGWVEWHRDANGKVDGARIYTSSRTPLYAAGIRNGDVIHAVNDRQFDYKVDRDA